MSAADAASPTGAPARRRRLLVAWVAVAVVLAVTLAVGGRRPSPAPTPIQRAAAIEADVRCPSCEDISVAQSSAPTAQAIRQAVAARIAGGQSDAAIEAWLVSRYGPAILLRPSTGGGTSLVWVLPVVAVAVALGGLGTVFWRRRRVAPVALSDEDQALVDRALVDRALAGSEGP